MKFSIIIPCYNIERYIGRTIECVLKQTFRNYELILVNDGSTDNTLKILEEYKKNDKRIKVINKTNEGVSSARNVGLEIAKCDYIYFLDGDDIISLDLFETMDNYLSLNQKIEMVSFGYNIYINEKLKKSLSFPKYNNKLFESNEFLIMYLNGKIKQCMCSFIVKREIVEKNNLWFDENTYHGEDQEFQIKAMIHSNKIAYLANTFFQYRMRENSAVSVVSAKYLTLIDVFSRLLVYFDVNKCDRIVIKNLKLYSVLEFFYVFRLVSKSRDKTLLRKVIEKDKIVNNNVLIGTVNSLVIKILIFKFIYKVNHNLLSWMFRKV